MGVGVGFSPSSLESNLTVLPQITVFKEERGGDSPRVDIIGFDLAWNLNTTIKQAVYYPPHC